MNIELTQEEATNLLALINRAQINGSEAEVAVLLKQKIMVAMQAESNVNGKEPVAA